jgi:methyl coenzyme M reductase subunit C
MLAGLVGLTVVVMSLVLWAILSGEAGTQRGLVVRNEVSETVIVSLEDGQTHEIKPREQFTFVLKRENFPQTLTATTLAGALVAEQEFPYDEIASAEFRWDVDRAGFFPTQEIRTVVP